MLSLKVGSGAEGSGSLPGGEESVPPREVEKSLPRKAAAEGVGAQQQQAVVLRNQNCGPLGAMFEIESQKVYSEGKGL
ncbi:UNVERIFIED_CONTAM: hypothetical protein K2H54_052962 [Gekko kuhli]